VLSTGRSDVDYSRTNFLTARDRYYYFYVPLGEEAKTVGDARVIEKDKPFEPKMHEDVRGEYEHVRVQRRTAVQRETTVAGRRSRVECGASAA